MMKVRFGVVGMIKRPPEVWTYMPAIPQIGDVVNLPGVPKHASVVRSVVWHPLGTAEPGDVGEPYVDVVLGQG